MTVSLAPSRYSDEMPRTAADQVAGHVAGQCDTALTRAFEFLGKRWNGVILGTLAEGATGFSALSRSIAGISDSMLSRRLVELVEAGLVRRIVDQGPPVSVTYALSASGEALIPALREVARWADANLARPGKAAGRRRAGARA
jgi:DNA-binding HxlR family transcriptional regulator